MTRLQYAASRFQACFRGIAEGRHKLSTTIGRMGELPARWRGRISDIELVRRLESMQRIVDGSIAVTSRVTQITQFSAYADPRIGIGPGNVNEALAAYRLTKTGIAEAIRCASDLRQSVQKQTWLAEFGSSAVQALDQIGGHIGLLNAEIGKSGEI